MSCCGRRTCACQIAAGANVTVSGDGSTGAPYVISATGGSGGPVDCADVRPCLSAGDGIGYDPATGVISADVSADPGNALSIGSDGGLLATAPAPTCDQVRPCLSAGDGATYDPATGVIEAGVSGDAGNVLSIGSDGGLLVPAPPAPTCDQVRPCLSAGDGIGYDPATGVISADLSADAGNALSIGADGGLYAPTASGDGTSINVTDTPTIDLGLSGTGTGGDPYTLTADVRLDATPPGGGTNLLTAGADGLYVECAGVRGCLSAGDGATYDPATGVIEADVSGDAGNLLGIGSDGGLLVTAPAPEPLVAGCGLDGAGTAGDPLAVATSGVWPLADRIGQVFPCDGTNATSEIYCASDGTLHSRPESTTVVGVWDGLTTPNLTLNAGESYTFTQDIPWANFSECRYMHVVAHAAAIVDLTVNNGSRWAVYGAPLGTLSPAPLGELMEADGWNSTAKQWVRSIPMTDENLNVPPGDVRVYQLRLDVVCVTGSITLNNIGGSARYHGTTI